jgi:uncharacterized protein YjbJ (UPF0337 family)
LEGSNHGQGPGNQRRSQAVGKALGDAKLESDGKADKIEGKVQNAIDMLKGK